MKPALFYYEMLKALGETPTALPSLSVSDASIVVTPQPIISGSTFVTFASTDIGNTATQTITITNTGDGNLVITNATTTSDFNITGTSTP
jgi:hypothetical protein